MEKPKETKSAYWKELRSFWWKEIKSWLGWGNMKQTVTTSIIAVGSIWLLARGGYIDLANEEINIRIAAMIVGLFWLLVIIVISYAQANMAIYIIRRNKSIDDKRRADKTSWNDINMSCEEIKEDERIIAYKVKVENKKYDPYYFFVELKYLELDGKCVPYAEDGKCRILSWASGGFGKNLQDGVLLRPPNEEIGNIGYWELFRILNNGKKYNIIYSEYNQKSVGQTKSKSYCQFSNIAKGELRLDGKYIQRSISTGGLGSGKPHIEVIRGDFVYRFRIDIINGEPNMTMFEPGMLEYHLDSEAQEVSHG